VPVIEDTVLTLSVGEESIRSTVSRTQVQHKRGRTTRNDPLRDAFSRNGQPKWQGDLPELARPVSGRLMRLPRWRIGRYRRRADVVLKPGYSGFFFPHNRRPRAVLDADLNIAAKLPSGSVTILGM
jgi:hypothetical protein